MNLSKGKRPFALTRDIAVLIHTCIQQRRILLKGAGFEAQGIIANPNLKP